MASVKPAKLLQGSFVNLGAVGFLDDATSVWNGYATEWSIQLTITAQTMSDPGDDSDYVFNALDIVVGDWIAMSPNIALRIKEITEPSVDGSTITVVVEDQDLYNLLSDPTSAGSSIGYEGPCVVFELSPDGLPIVGPLYGAPVELTLFGDIIARFIRTGRFKAGGGGSDFLNAPSDGSFSDGFITNWVPGVTRISDAIDDINEALLVAGNTQELPDPLSIKVMAVDGAIDHLDGNPIMLAEGFTDNTLTGSPEKPVAGDAASVTTATLVNSLEVKDFIDGARGTLELRVNGSVVGSRNLSTSSDIGVYDNLEITADIDTPTGQPGARQILSARAQGVTLLPGLNSLQLSHSTTGSSHPAYVVLDSSTALPIISNVIMNFAEGSPLEFSSGIPHFGRGSQILLQGEVENLATDVALSRKNVEFSTYPVATGPTTWLSAGSNGLPRTLAKHTLYSFHDIVYDIDDLLDLPAYGSVSMRLTASNTNGKTLLDLPTKLNIMRKGEAPVEFGPIIEQAVPVVNLGELVAGDDIPVDAYRVALGDGLNPFIADPTTIPLTQWDSAIQLNTDEYLHEASVVGGVARFDKTDYASFIPPGPDYSNKKDMQYITFAIRRTAVSKMMIQVRGRYKKLAIMLPGIPDMPSAPLGWWDASKLYEGWDVPGRNGSDGCALGEAAFGFSQDITVTFGPITSSSSTNNLILVRFQLGYGDNITGLRFCGVE